MMELPKISNFFYALRETVKIYPAKILSYFYVRVYLLSLAAVNISAWLAARSIYAEAGGDSIALHYSVNFGINLIGPPQRIFIAPLLGLALITMNIALLCAVSGHRGRKFISHLLLSGALACNIILLVSVRALYLVNFR